ncbi:MAG TPA: aminoacyl-tRNA hydrolase [Planctomycetota bacterium]|nr:aminoacyl-tRNA hydrolase [Planctomycetota bacterium]
MKLIVGLGNPGGEYAKTRHNVGFRVLDRLAERLGTAFDRNKFKGEYATSELPDGKEGFGNDDGKLLLVKPQTYMNLSGETVLGFSGFYKIGLTRLLVVSDDVTLPVGALRMRRGGSDGGHNGLKDITLRLGDQNYARLRVGVGGREEGAQRPAGDLAGHVLSRFSAEEEQVLVKRIDLAADACLFWAEKGVEAAMNKFNTK